MKLPAKKMEVMLFARYPSHGSALEEAVLGKHGESSLSFTKNSSIKSMHPIGALRSPRDRELKLRLLPPCFPKTISPKSLPREVYLANRLISIFVAGNFKVNQTPNQF